MIHAEFKLFDRFSKVLIDIPSLSPSEELTEAVMSQTGNVMDAISVSNTLKLRKDTFPEIERYSDGFQLTVEVERRPRDVEGGQTLDEYKDMVETDLLELHDIFRDLVRDTIQELENPYPGIFLRHG